MDGVKSALYVALGVGLSLALAGCDACTGILGGCRTGEHLAYVGHVVRHTTGSAVPNTRIVFIRTGGVAVTPDSIDTASGSDGFFRIEATAASSGYVVADLRVYPPNGWGKPFAIRNYNLKTTRIDGDGGQFGRIAIDPYIVYVARGVDATTGEVLTANAPISFKRTGGIAVEPEVFETTADDFGNFVISPLVTEPGFVYGDLTMGIPQRQTSYTVPIVINTEPFDGPQRLFRTIQIPSP